MSVTSEDHQSDTEQQESSNPSDSSIDSQEKGDIVAQTPLGKQETMSPLKLRNDARKSMDLDDDMNSALPLKRLSEYREVDQMEYYAELEVQCMDYVRQNGKLWIDSEFPPNN